MFTNTKPARLSSAIATARLTLLALALLCAANSSMAAKPDKVTDEEMALIPTYCPYTQSWGQYLKSPTSKQWAARIGSRPFSAIHHYCWGQIKQQRALRSGTPELQRKFLLEGARNDYDFVATNSPHDFILLPEIYTRIGEVELHLSQFRNAERAFAHARKLKRDYWPAYSHWAEHLIQTGKTADAKSLVETGLKYSPDSRVLRAQSRLLESGQGPAGKEEK